MKQLVALALVLEGLVLRIHWITAAAAGGPSLSITRPAGHEEKPQICRDEGTEPGGSGCSPGILAEQDDPPIDMRPVDIETVGI